MCLHQISLHSNEVNYDLVGEFGHMKMKVMKQRLAEKCGC